MDYRQIKQANEILKNKLADDKYHQRYLLTAKQKKILKVFDIEEDE
ncbi:MAG: hypothetical protein IJ875_02255 [Solobacterium sp.]|nr:hypothetical protein [Solobacterium sp.]